jgi:methylated-DNA-[protein]-cysteine S-methyltransferase
MKTKYIYTYNTGLSPLTVMASETALERLNFGDTVKDAKKTSDVVLVHEENDITRKVCYQIGEYLAGNRHEFDIALSLHGTDFQMMVWAALQEIRWGKTKTYKEIAAACGREKACRAAGGAIHNNPVAIIIPCHRVIGSDGSLTGFAGGLAIKQRLLNIEGYQNGKGSPART